MVARVLLGKHPDGVYGLRVSEPGYDVLTNPLDPERMVFDSQWTALNPILLRGQATVSASTSSAYATTTVNFGETLAYAPMFFALWTKDGTTWTRAITRRYATNGAVVQPTTIALAYVDRIKFFNYDTTSGATINYIVFKTPAFAS